MSEELLQAFARMTIRHLPEEIALGAVLTVASRPPRMEMSDEAAAALNTGIGLATAPGAIPAWSWGDGPNVLLVHGWGGRAAQMASIAQSLAARGYRTVAFDVAGHGASPHAEARWEYFIRDIARLAHWLGDVEAVVGHSAGGLAAMAARRASLLHANKFVCVCAPAYPYPPIRRAEQRFDPGPRVIERFKTYLGEQFQTTWSDLENGWAYEGAGSDLLLYYDEGDRFVDPADGRRINKICPGSRLVMSSGFGHTRILSSTDAVCAIAEFLNAPTPRVTPAATDRQADRAGRTDT
jgi:pimeloyl-ACP methyl ester carboxylesterase